MIVFFVRALGNQSMKVRRDNLCQQYFICKKSYPIRHIDDRMLEWCIELVVTPLSDEWSLALFSFVFSSHISPD